MKNVEKLPGMDLHRPPNHIVANQALAKGRHRLICAPRLSLVVCDLLLLALLILQRLAHAAAPLMCRIRPRNPIYVQILYNSFLPDVAPHRTFISIPSLFQQSPTRPIAIENTCPKPLHLSIPPDPVCERLQRLANNALAPILFTQPITNLGRMSGNISPRLYADATNRRVRRGVSDQEILGRSVGSNGDIAVDPVMGVLNGVGMREGVGHPLADIVIVALASDGGCVGRDVLTDFAHSKGKYWSRSAISSHIAMRLFGRILKIFATWCLVDTIRVLYSCSLGMTHGVSFFGIIQ